MAGRSGCSANNCADRSSNRCAGSGIVVMTAGADGASDSCTSEPARERAAGRICATITGLIAVILVGGIAAVGDLIAAVISVGIWGRIGARISIGGGIGVAVAIGSVRIISAIISRIGIIAAQIDSDAEVGMASVPATAVPA